mgnify:CR=1 FL=1
MRTVCFLWMIAFISACGERERSLSLNLKQIQTLDSIPSGSAIVQEQERLILITDDAPFLYIGKDSFSFSSLQLKGYEPVPYRIPKDRKPDFEAASSVVFSDGRYIAAFGSGSVSPSRDSLLLIEVADLSRQTTISLTPLYRHLINTLSIAPRDWNIEGVAVIDDQLLLLNRGDNRIIFFPVVELERYLSQGTLPVPQSYVLSLPRFQGKLARLSGACALGTEGDVLFCASIEDTPDWHSDGAVLGSFIGVFHHPTQSLKGVVLLKDSNGNALREKVESVEVVHEQKGVYTIVAAVDNDDGNTRLLRLEMTWR